MAGMPLKSEDVEARELPSTTVNEVPINASGHSEQLERNYGLLSMTGLAICSGSTWVTFGGAIVSVSIHISQDATLMSTDGSHLQWWSCMCLV